MKRHSRTISTSITIPADLPVRNMALFSVMDRMFTAMYKELPDVAQAFLWHDHEADMKIMEQLFSFERKAEPTQLKEARQK